MAKKKLDDINKAGGDIKNTFSEIGNLINELNTNLEKTLKLTQGVTDNMSEGNNLGQESIGKEEQKTKILEKIGGLKSSEQKQLLDGLKTGKGLNKDLMAKVGLEGKAGTLAGTAAAVKLKSLGVSKASIGLQAAKNKLQEMGLLTEEGKLNIQNLQNAAMDIFLTQLMAADKETTAMARGLNMSKSEAVDLKQQFAAIAVNSGDIAINSIRLGKANAGLNAQLGTGVVFSGEMLTTFSKLTEIVGISADAAGSLAFQGQMAGQSFREVEENVLGASYEMQRGVGIQLDMKGVLEATGKVTGQVRANLGATPELIAKAVTAAKLLGTELETIVNAGKAQLDFESSIASEMEAELLTGKQLNLERMRAAALAGDQATVVAELAKNVGTHGEFMKMNVLQQEALAKAMGMSTDSMADMLFKQETMGMNAKQLRAQGKDELADKLEQLDTQEKLALAQEKFAATMGDIATFAMPLIEGFGYLVQYLAESTTALAIMGTIMAGLAISSLVSAITSIMTTFSFIPFGIGIPLALAAVGGMYAMISSAKSKVKDGFAPSSKGPFTIMDNYGGMAKTTPGDNVQVGPSSAKASAQPVVIQNNWDAFAASNGNGRKGLGGTQSLQASPTFA